MSKGENIATVLINAINEIKNVHEFNYKNINDLDLESQDLLHELELSKFNASEGYKLAKELQQVRQERRKLKDENDTLQLLYDYFSDPKLKSIVNDLCNIRGKIKKTQTNQQNRLYTPKIRKDLTIPTNDAKEGLKWGT